MDLNPTPPTPGTGSVPAAAPPPKRGMHPRATLAILLLACLFVLMPFLFWRASWFGAPMSAQEITDSLAPSAEPRKIQHALAQLSSRMDRADSAARQWYPAIVAEAKHPDPQIRLTAAWVMGRDNSAPEFHQALSAMLGDPDPMVRVNAALSLVRFADSSGRPQLLALLQPYVLVAPAGFGSGTLRQRLQLLDAVRPGTLVARIDAAQGVVEVRSQVPGKLAHWLQPTGATVLGSQPLCVLSPDPQSAWEALRALYLIGQPDDVPVVASFLRTNTELPSNVAEQAHLTLQALQSRK
jgi:HEAT repeat protein